MTQRILPVLAWVALIAALAAWHVTMEWTGARRGYFSSDTMTMEMLYRDVAAGNSLKEWRFSPAPSFFPDMPLYIGLRSLGLEVPSAVLAFAAVYFSIMFSGVLALWRVFPVGQARQGRGAMELAMAVGCLFAAWRWCVREITFTLAMAFHSGIFVFLPWVLWLAFRVCGVPSEVSAARRAWMLTVLGVLLVLMVASDQLSLFQLVVPVMGLAFWLAVAKRCPWRHGALVIAVSAVATMAGFGLYRLLNLYPALDRFTKWTWPFGNDSVMQACEAWLGRLWNTYPLNVLVTAAFVVVSVWVVVLAVLRRGRDENARALPAALAFAYLAASISNLGILLFAGHREVGAMSRYQYVLLLVPVLWGWPLLLQGFVRVQKWFMHGRYHAWLCGLAVIVIAATIPHLRKAHVLARYADYYPGYVQCLDTELARRGLTRGVADYWRAKEIAALSRHGLQLARVSPELKPVFALCNWASYRMKPEFVITKPDEILVSHLITPDMVMGRFGLPADWFVCDSLLVLVYNRPTDTAFHELFADYQGPPVY